MSSCHHTPTLTAPGPPLVSTARGRKSSTDTSTPSTSSGGRHCCHGMRQHTTQTTDNNNAGFLSIFLHLTLRGFKGRGQSTGGQTGGRRGEVSTQHSLKVAPHSESLGASAWLCPRPTEISWPETQTTETTRHQVQSPDNVNLQESKN